MSKKIRELQAKRAAAAQAKNESLKSAGAILEKANTEARDLTDDEQAQFDSYKASADAKGAEMSRIQAQIDIEQDIAAQSAFVEPVADAYISVTENADKDEKRGFKSFGDFMSSVHQAALPNMRPDPRLAATPSLYAGESTGADGGFLVPPEFSKEIFTLSLTEDSLLPLTDTAEISSNSMVIPKDETTPWGTNGIRAYWQGESSAATGTKPVLGAMALRLKKLMALVPASDEMLEDSTMLTSYLPNKIADSIRWKTNEALLFGTGGPVPFGAFSGNAVITQAKDTGQATKTLTATNLANMIARLPPASFGRAVWLINNDVLPALFTLTLGNYPIYFPMGNQQTGAIQTSPYGTLLGRPVIVTQHANTFSSQGDVLLADMSYVQTITKAGGFRTDTSMHIYFDADATAFRTVFRLDAQPKITAAISPAKGANSLSPFVQLAAR